MGIIARSEVSLFGVNLFLWAVLLVYLYGLRLVFMDGNSVPVPTPEISGPTAPSPSEKFRHLLLPFLGYFACALVILFSAPYLVGAADKLARISGLGHTFIGTTLVALATSLPELIATLAAFRIGSPDLALGNIFGSNAFNMLLFIPLDFLYPRALFAAVNSLHAVTAMSVIMTTSLAVMGQLYRKKERSRLTEPSSEAVVVVSLIALYLLYKL